MFKKDNQLTGIICGILAPILGFYIYSGITFHTPRLGWLIKFFIENHKTSAVLSLCLIANLAVFFLFIWRNRDQSARGILLVTIIYAIIGAVLKFCC